MPAVLLTSFCISMLGHILPLSTPAGDDQETSQLTWQTLAELTEEGQSQIDPRTDTPRDSQYPYFPEERYPFEPSFTTEELGFRALEFSH